MTENKIIHINLFSFGHSFGIPKHIDLLYSIRDFPSTNIENYQHYDGRYKRIQNELFNLVEYNELIKTIIKQLKIYLNEHSTNSINLAVGCEQGRHRSVAVIERLGELLNTDYNIQINHRDIERKKRQ